MSVWNNGMFDPLIILCALVCGLIVRGLGFPALLGYLAAGFVLHELSAEAGPVLYALAEVGITLLLFSIGLKLHASQLLKSRVWGTSIVHMVVLQVLFGLLLWLAATLVPSLGLEFRSSMILAFALTFSSTVFVLQWMQERGEAASRHADLAIGILIIQDIAAVIFLGFTAGKVPQPEALWLLLVFPLRGVILKLMALCGRGELFTLFGLALAIGGAQIFDSVGVKGDLGALILGAVLAGDAKAKELAKNLLHFKDLFLVSFFLTIGMSGWPSQEIMIAAVILAGMAVLKPPMYFLLMTRFHTTPRTALLASNALANYSEFGLIVVVVAASAGWIDEQWSAALSVSIALSFLLSTSLNMRSHELYRRWHDTLVRFQTGKLRRSQPVIKNGKIMVLGMGNIGTGAYTAMQEQYGDIVVGVDDNDRKLIHHRQAGRRVVAADASDPDFWDLIDLDDLQLVMLALTNHEENKLIGKLLRELGYTGAMAAVIRFPEEAEQLEKHGMSCFNLYAEAGQGFARHALSQIPLGHSSDAPRGSATEPAS